MKNQLLLRLAMVPFIFTLLAKTLKVSAESNLTDDYNSLFLLVTVVSVIVSALVIGMWAYFIYRFRESNETERKELNHAQTRKLELTWTVLAVVIVIFLMIFSYPVLFKIDQDTENLVADEIIIVEGNAGWQWLFYHEDGSIDRPNTIVEDGFPISETTLTLEVGKIYKFILWASGELYHSFFVPDLKFKADVVPGFNNTFTIKITSSGDFPIYCAELCGFGHSGMRGTILARDP